jgi:uncharacterized membrane protein YidH (DUF202 family)
VELTNLFLAELAQRRKDSTVAVELPLQLVAVVGLVRLVATPLRRPQAMEETEFLPLLPELASLALVAVVVVTTLTLAALCQALEPVV